MNQPFDIVILGLSITSSWGNGHATTYRSLVRGLAARGHRILFLERDVPWYSENRDSTQPEGATTSLYENFEELTAKYEEPVSQAKLVIVGSYVPDGIQVGRWVTSIAKGRTAFYDIDTPITLAALENRTAEYISPTLIREYDAYFSFTGGPTLRRIESDYGSAMARPLYCSVDAELYRPQQVEKRWDLGYLGTYSADRQPQLVSFLINPAEQFPGNRFVVAGPQFPSDIVWPSNVERISHLAPTDHPAFYSQQRFTLNLTRDAMRKAGYSPSVRLFEAAACGVPIISDWWTGLESIFDLGTEVLVARDEHDVIRYLKDTPFEKLQQIAAGARARILKEHTSEARAIQLEQHWKEMNDNFASGKARGNRCSGESVSGVERRMEPEQQRESSGEQPQSQPVGVTAGSGLFKSAGKNI